MGTNHLVLKQNKTNAEIPGIKQHYFEGLEAAGGVSDLVWPNFNLLHTICKRSVTLYVTS